MIRTVLRDDQWDCIKNLLPGKATDCGVTAGNNRSFVEAVLWIARTGSPWRDLPGIGTEFMYGYNRWSKKGILETILEAVADDPDLDYLMVDGSIVRVHPHGAAKKQSGNESMGHSRDGLSTKIHAVVDALGNPKRFILSAGQSSEYFQAEALIDEFNSQYILADRGYDSDDFVTPIVFKEAIPDIPPRKNIKSKPGL